MEDLIPHLFRTEYRKLVSVLTRHFGFGQVETAEDIAGDTFFAAAQTWPLDGIPKNPTAWLYTVAKNKAKNYLHRQSIFKSRIAPEIKHNAPSQYEEEIDLSAENIRDSQLRMMFAICHPSISAEAQVGLSLRILCGFGIEEIAAAFLSNKEAVNKRLFRAREKLREEKIELVLPAPAELDQRLATVLTTLYLLFNEGYYSISQDRTLRKELCLEAMRLCYMLIENPATNKPEVNALLSLMCFHASRFEARFDKEGAIILYEEQDTALWNKDLIGKGGYFLQQASVGTRLTKYHLEAGIAYWHTQKEDSVEKWENILQFYNRLLQLEYSPVAALNRTFALAKANGKEEAIREAEKLGLEGHQFYHALLGELYTDLDNTRARHHFTEALALAGPEADKQAMRRKLERLPGLH
jgi:RNA polymerase sigma-70 factor (ECF subfamily)